MKPIYVNGAAILLYDAAETHQNNEWTLRHVEQCFCRRSTVADIRALMEEDGFIVAIHTGRAPEGAAVVEVSMRLDSGRLMLSGGDPGGLEVWSGRPGWARVHVGQTIVEPGERPKLALHLDVEPDGEERPTRVYGDWGRPLPSEPYLETAEILRLPKA